MQKIGHIPNAFADGNDEFTEDPLMQSQPTHVKAQWLNTVQRELAAMVETEGEPLNPGHDDQIAQWINKNTPLRTQAIPVCRPTTGFYCFPEILTADQCLALIVNPDRTILVAPGQSWVWRGVWKISSDDYLPQERTFRPQANHLYHLRWTMEKGFCLCALTDVAYNPHGLSEDHPYFDTSVDHLLAGRIYMDGAGNIHITPLKNSPELKAEWNICVPAAMLPSLADQTVFIHNPIASLILSWARTPRLYLTGVSGINYGKSYRAYSPENDQAFAASASRYQALFYDYRTTGSQDQPVWHYALCA